MHALYAHSCCPNTHTIAPSAFPPCHASLHRIPPTPSRWGSQPGSVGLTCPPVQPGAPWGHMKAQTHGCMDTWMHGHMDAWPRASWHAHVLACPGYWHVLPADGRGCPEGARPPGPGAVPPMPARLVTSPRGAYSRGALAQPSGAMPSPARVGVNGRRAGLVALVAPGPGELLTHVIMHC